MLDGTEPEGFEDFEPRRDHNEPPSLVEIRRAGAMDADCHAGYVKNFTKEALDYFLRQAGRCHVAIHAHGLSGKKRYRDDDSLESFACELGLSYDVATKLEKLHPVAADVLTRCELDRRTALAKGRTYKYPSWRVALGWFVPKEPKPEQQEQEQKQEQPDAVTDLTAQLSTAQNEIKAAADREFELSGRIKEIETENESLRSERATLSAENESLKGERATLSAENESLRSERETLSAENESLKARVAFFVKEMERIHAGAKAPDPAAADEKKRKAKERRAEQDRKAKEELDEMFRKIREQLKGLGRVPETDPIQRKLHLDALGLDPASNPTASQVTKAFRSRAAALHRLHGSDTNPEYVAGFNLLATARDFLLNAVKPE